MKLEEKDLLLFLKETAQSITKDTKISDLQKMRN